MIAVSARMKRTEPRNPPRMVIIFDAPSWDLNNCMPANVMRQRMEDTTHETDVGRAIVAVVVVVVVEVVLLPLPSVNPLDEIYTRDKDGCMGNEIFLCGKQRLGR